jgi:hypothetical protein
MEKYKFTKLSMDQYKLEYKDQVIEFNSKVDYVKQLQEVNKTARLKMIADLTEKGISVKDLVREVKKDGKTLYDNSNKEYIEEAYIQEVQQEVFSNIIKTMMGKTLEELIIDIGLTEEEITEFGNEIGKILVGNTSPSGEK